MIQIIDERRTGKTTKLIEESAKTGCYILVASRCQAKAVFKLAIELGMVIPYPVTINEIDPHKVMGSSLERDGILVDEALIVLQKMIGLKIKGVAISINEFDGVISARKEKEASVVVTSFSTRLRQALDARNMKQITLSEKSGVSRSLISAYLKGEYEAKRDKLSALAEALKVNEKWLAGLDVSMDR